MTSSRSYILGRTRWLCLLVGFAEIWLFALSLTAAEPSVRLKKIEPPARWNAPENIDRWIRTTDADWQRFKHALSHPGDKSPPPGPVVVDANYRAIFDGASLTQGTLDWKIDRIGSTPGFISLGKSSLAIAQLNWQNREAVHGVTATGEWMLWCESDENQLSGHWSHRGDKKLDTVVFPMALPRALSSHLEIAVPDGWQAHVHGTIGTETPGEFSSDKKVWSFELGRQQKFQLTLSKPTASNTPQILLKESTVYGLNNTDDLIRLQTDLECTVSGGEDVELVLNVPKPLRVLNVLLGSELPLTFVRELGGEEDRIKIPLRSLTPGERITLRILGEATRRSDRPFSLPRPRPVNALYQEGNIRLAVFRPLEVRSVEIEGLRQTQLTEEEGQEIRAYEVLSNACTLSLQVGEPTALLQGEVLFIADVRGESPTSRVRMRLSTREGELFSPRMQIPEGWDLITVDMAESSDIVPTAWQVTQSPTGDNQLDIELRQPIRPDRDCTLLLEFKSVALKPGAARRLPIPRLLDPQTCYVRGVVWDIAPWELDESSTGSVELDGNPADEDLIQSVKWTRSEDSRAIPTGIRITGYNSQVKTLFRAERTHSTNADQSGSHGDDAAGPSLLCANLELETRTSRVGKSHPHRALFQFTRPTTPGEFRLTLPPEGELARIIADEREISFVRRSSEIILDPASKPFTELVLEYRTSASPGWIVSRDEVVFPQLSCFVTEFAWHLVLDPERILYRLPFTAAVSPRELPQTWERLLGPLARHAGENVFNPFSRKDWSALINGTTREGSKTPPQDAWFVASHTPERITMKTWKLDVSHGLAWCSFLGFVAGGIALRRARRSWFRRSWIYLGGLWLVLAVFVAEPYAPIAGGAFLGTILAIIVPRRFAIGSDLLDAPQAPPSSKYGSTAIITGCLLVAGLNRLSPVSHGQEEIESPELAYFQIEDQGQTYVIFDSEFRPQWTAWREEESGPSWLLKSCRYEVQSEVSGPPRITATYQVTVFGDVVPTLLKLPLSGVSLDQVEGLIDGQTVRLIPAADRLGFLLPVNSDKGDKLPAPPPAARLTTEPRPVTNRTIVLKFRPLPEALNDDQSRFSATIPPLPESTVVFQSGRWRLDSDSLDASPPGNSASPRTVELGPASQLKLQTGPPALLPIDNVSDVQLRTLIECGPLGAKLQIAALPVMTDSLSPAEVTLSLPPGIFIQSLSGPSLDESKVNYSAQETRVTLRLRPSRFEDAIPVLISAFMPIREQGFQLLPPRWKPLRSQQSPTDKPEAEALPDSRLEKSFVGVVAKPGFRITDTTNRLTIVPVSPQAFSDSLFTSLDWQTPDLAWTCRDANGPSWTIEAIPSAGRGTLVQTMTLKVPQSDWRLEAGVTTAQGIPFEHVFKIDRRIDIHRASVQQDGADRLLHWTRIGDELRLSIRDGQPGTQTIIIDGSIAQGGGAWEPPVCDYLSGQTVESSVIVRNSSRVTSTLRWADSTTRLRPNLEQSDEEIRYRPGTPSAPLNIRVEPVSEERSARVWVDLLPQRDRPWQVTLRLQLKDSLPFAAAVRIIWDQPGLTDLRMMNSHEITSGKGLTWRPQTLASKPAELTLTAAIDESTFRGQPIRLPQFSGIAFSEIWVSLPRGSGYRPMRSSSSLLPASPANWPATWTENLISAREDLYSCSSRELTIEATSSEPIERPVRAETLIWMDGGIDPASGGCTGITKYLMIAERETTLEIPKEVRTFIRAIAVDGHTQPVESHIRIPSRTNDLSHEIVVWWQSEGSPPETMSRDLIRLPGSLTFPHWIGVVPPHQQVLLDLWGQRTSLLSEFWLDRAESILKAASEFQGAPWSVDGPLLHQLADSRDELSRVTELSKDENRRNEVINFKWQAFSQTGGSITSPPVRATGEPQFSGLDAILALCGESRSLWLSSDKYPYSGPRLLDRRWAITITATLASLVSLLLLTWIVSIFRRLDVAEKLAAHPHSTMVGLGFIWWIFFSPSVLGLAIVLLGMGLGARDRLLAARAQAAATAANSPV